MDQQTLFGYQNVYWDAASQYSITAVNERSYLQSLFGFLRNYLHCEFENFQFYIFFSHHAHATPISAAIAGSKKILIWFSDESGTKPEHLRDAYRVIFKTYIKKESGNVYANALGYINEFEEESKPAVAKDIIVFFSGNLNENRLLLYRMLLMQRYPILQILRLLPAPVSRRVIHLFKHKALDLSRGDAVFYFSHGFRSGLRYPDYFKFLLRSKYVITPRGFESTETFRHIEALSAGCILISEPMPSTSVYPDPPFLTFSSISDLQQILEKVERGEYDEKQLAKSHKHFFESHLTVQASARRMAKICLENR